MVNMLDEEKSSDSSKSISQHESDASAIEEDDKDSKKNTKHKKGDHRTKSRTKELSWLTILSYAAPMIGSGGMNFTLTTFAAYFYTDTLGLPPGTVGRIQLTLMIMYAISEPIFGSISDMTRGSIAKKFGRRKPYLAISAILHAATFYCLVAPPIYLNSSNGLKEWAFTFAFVLGISWGCNEVTYQALGAQLTFDYDERTKLQAVAVAVITIGSTSCGLLHGILGSTLGVTVEANRLRFMILAIVYSSIFILGSFLMLFLINEETVETFDDNNFVNISFIDWIYIGWVSVTEMFYNLPFFLLTVSYSCTLLAGAVTPMLLPYFTKYVVATEFSSNWAPLLFTASAVIGTPFWVFLGGLYIRMEKKWRFIIAAAWLATFLALSGGLVQNGDDILFILLSVSGGLAMGGYFATPEAMKPDVVDYDEFRTGARHEARFAGVFMLFANLSAGVGLECMLLALELCGYDGTKQIGEPQSKNAIMAIRIGYGGTLCIMGVFMFLSMLFYPITRNKHQLILEATQKRLNCEYAPDPLYGGPPLPPYENIPMVRRIQTIPKISRKNTFMQQVRLEVGPLASLHGDRSGIRNVP